VASSCEPAGGQSPQVALRVYYLQRSPLSCGLSRAQLWNLAGSACAREIKRRQAFFREGEPATAVGLLCSGRVKVTQLTSAGREVIVQLLGPGEVLGGLGALAGGHYPATAEALEASQALVWEQHRLEELFDEVPVLARNALRIMADWVRELEERYRELATEPVAQRLAYALVRLDDRQRHRADGSFDLSLSQEELAQMTGTTLFTVSRLLSEWESKGILTTRRERVLVRDHRGLAALLDGAGSELAGP